MGANNLSFGVDPENVRQLTVETMIKSACEIIARAPFVDEDERYAALAKLADSVLPSDVEIAFDRVGDDGSIRRTRTPRGA